MSFFFITITVYLHLVEFSIHGREACLYIGVFNTQGEVYVFILEFSTPRWRHVYILEFSTPMGRHVFILQFTTPRGRHVFILEFSTLRREACLLEENVKEYMYDINISKNLTYDVKIKMNIHCIQMYMYMLRTGHTI